MSLRAHLALRVIAWETMTALVVVAIFGRGYVVTPLTYLESQIGLGVSTHTQN